MAETMVEVLREDSGDENRTKATWSELLPELLHLVSSHLIAGDLAIFRAVCKSWHSIDAIRPLSSPLNNCQVSIDAVTHGSPYLLSLLDNGTCRFFHPLYKGVYPVDFPELSGARIRFSKHGWLLLTREDCSVLFFNPFTREEKQLPHYPNETCAFATICFSSPPTCSSWFVIGITIGGGCFYILRSDDQESWEYHELYGLHGTNYVSRCPPILYEGHCYLMGFLGEIRVFNIDDTESEVTYLPEVHSLPISEILGSSDMQHLVDTFPVRRGYMAEDEGELVVVYVSSEEEKHFHIRRFDLTRWRWRRRKPPNFGDKMLYVSPGASFVQTAEARGMNNKVYLPRVAENSCLFYSLATAKYSSFGGNYSRGIPSYSKYLPNSTWIHPNYTLLKS